MRRRCRCTYSFPWLETQLISSTKGDGSVMVYEDSGSDGGLKEAIYRNSPITLGTAVFLPSSR